LGGITPHDTGNKLLNFDKKGIKVSEENTKKNKLIEQKQIQRHKGKVKSKSTTPGESDIGIKERDSNGTDRDLPTPKGDLEDRGQSGQVLGETQPGGSRTRTETFG